MTRNTRLIKDITDLLKRNKLTLSIAESCTGGLVSDNFLRHPGASLFFTAGVVAYSNSAKEHLLHICPKTLSRHGAVSAQVALAMATRVKTLTHSDIGLSVTGIAGPSGGSPLKPIGTVYIAATIGQASFFKKYLFRGQRRRIQTYAATAAVNFLKQCLNY